MAPVAVEDCLLHIASPFLLIQIAAKRARQLSRGAHAIVPAGNHKSTTTALREIAGGGIDARILDEEDLPLPDRLSPPVSLAGLN
jgi:DNA-directed RNA polymerase subunit omega